VKKVDGGGGGGGGGGGDGDGGGDKGTTESSLNQHCSHTSESNNAQVTDVFQLKHAELNCCCVLCVRILFFAVFYLVKTVSGFDFSLLTS
jgi:hypothetical protein